MATIALTQDNYHEVVTDRGIVLIDFWASWCGPCLRFAPVYDQASEKHTDVTFAKVDTEDQQELAGSFGIRSIPTLVAYRDGIPVYAEAGALPAETFEELVGKIRALDMDEVRRKVATQR